MYVLLNAQLLYMEYHQIVILILKIFLHSQLEEQASKLIYRCTLLLFLISSLFMIFKLSRPCSKAHFIAMDSSFRVPYTILFTSRSLFHNLFEIYNNYIHVCVCDHHEFLKWNCHLRYLECMHIVNFKESLL